MYKNLILMALVCGSASIKAEELKRAKDTTLVASFDMSGSELWHGYFLPDHILLIEQSTNNQDDFVYINHPSYVESDEPVHRLICDRGLPGEEDHEIMCKDEFPHVHINALKHVHFSDFFVANALASRVCETLGSGVVPLYIEPATFVDIDNNPNSSHEYLYNLSQGLTFDCVAQMDE